MIQTGIQPWMHRPKIDVIESARLGMFIFTGESASCSDLILYLMLAYKCLKAKEFIFAC